MRIVFFGSSAGAPARNRRMSSILVEVGENRYFVDMGTQSIEQLVTRRIPVTSVKGIFITHMHGDHTSGLPAFLDLASWCYKEADPAVYLPEPMEETIAALAAWIRCNRTPKWIARNGEPMRPFRFFPVTEGVMYQDEAVCVRAYKTRHTYSSYAFLIEAEGKRVFFSGDLCDDGPQVDFPVSVLDETLDLAICESAHFPATEYLPIFAGRQTLKQLCFNHYSEKRLHSVLEMRDALPGVEVFRAMDGTEIVL